MHLTPLERQQHHVAEATSTFWHRVRFDRVLATARQHGAEEVVDIGAGSGLLGEHLRGSGLRYRCSESSPSLREALAERFGADAVIADDAPIGRTALVALLDVIEHVADDHGLLRSIASRLAPGATLVVTAPAMPWLFSSWDTDLGHHRRYRRRELAATVASAGFEVAEASYLFPELVPPALIRRWRRSDGTSAEFPALPAWVDRAAGGVGRATTAARRIWPAGTSVLVVARREEGAS